MGNAIASLLVRLGLDDVEYRTGLTKNEYLGQQFQRKMDANFAKAARFVGALGIGAAVGAFVKDTISSASALDDLSDATGSSVENLSKLANQAKISGTDFATLEGLVHKLSAGMAGADDESSNVGRALKFLGVSAKDPAEALQQVAVSLDKYRDGIGKAALARDLFGKGGPAFLATLKDIANLQDVAATTSTRQAAEAEKLEQALRRLTVQAHDLKDALLGQVVPAMDRLLEQFTEGIRIAGGFWNSLRLFSTLPMVGSVGDAADALTELNQRINTIEQGKGLEGLTARITGQTERIVADLKKQRDFLELQQRQQINLVPGKKGGAADDLTVKLPAKYTGSKTGAAGIDDTARRIRDAQLKDLDRAIKAEEDLLRDREHFLNQYYQDDKLSITDYYAGRQNALDEAVSKQRAAYAEEQRIVTAFRPKDEKERIANQEKLADVIDKTSRFETDASRAYIDMTFEKERATKQFQESVERLSIALAAARGDTVGAATRGFDLNNRRFRDQLEASGMSTAGLDEDSKRTADRARLTKATEDYHQVLERLGISQERIDILARLGAIGEIESLNRRDALARKYIVTLTDQADAYEKIANAMNAGPEKSRALLEVDRMRLGIEQLGEQTDGLAKKINAGFGDSFADHLARIADGTESVRDGFKGMLKDWVHMLNQMAAKQVATSLFGQGGSAAGIGGLLASLFGGTAGAGAATSASWAAMSAATIPSFASGTNYAPGGWAKVHRDEVINLPRGSQVIPNSELTARREARGGNTYVINAPVAPGTTRQSVAQAAGELRRAIMMTERNS